ncbi:hypothetical protein [Nocardia xishanensis]|uniref:Uncharacterized protein n=1 Tax=Nocardia xishanensis TaxID=238964 RepID=A0ABW7X0T6_9NOCA
MRNYELFCEYLLDPAYGWGDVCRHRFGQIHSKWPIQAQTADIHIATAVRWSTLAARDRTHHLATQERPPASSDRSQPEKGAVGVPCNAEESAGTDSARMWRTWLTAETAAPQGQAQQAPFCTG